MQDDKIQVSYGGGKTKPIEVIPTAKQIAQAPFENKRDTNSTSCPCDNPCRLSDPSYIDFILITLN